MKFDVSEHSRVSFQTENERIQSEKLTKTLTDKRSKRQRKVIVCMLCSSEKADQTILCLTTAHPTWFCSRLTGRRF